MLSGPRGIGKSTIANTIGDEARAAGFRVVDLPCLVSLGTSVGECSAAQASTGGAPTLLLIDDLHLLDQHCRDRLAYAVKTAVHDPNVRCVATTTELLPPPLWREFSFHPLLPLPEADVRALLRERGVAATRQTSIVTQARGNPLAAIELARMRSFERCTETVPVPHLTDALAHIGAREVRDMEPAARRVMLRDVLAYSVTRAFGAGSEPERRCPPGNTVAELWIHASSSAEDRAEAHLELAADARLSSEERLVHRAHGVSTPDACLVDALEERAEDIASTRRYRQAALLLCRAAVLAPEHERALALETRAASIAAFAGFFDLADEIAARVRRGRRGTDSSETAAAEAFAAVMRGGEPRAALAAVVRALGRVPDSVHPDVLDQLVGSALAYSVVTGDAGAVAQALQWAVKYEQHLDPVNVLISQSLSTSGPSSHVRALDRPALQGAVLASLRGGEPWKQVLLHLALPLLMWHPDENRWLTDVLDTPAAVSPATAALERLRTPAVCAARGEYSAVIGADGDPDDVCFVPFADRLSSLRQLVATIDGSENGSTTIDLVARSQFEVAYERMRHRDMSALNWLSTPYGPLEMIDFVECCVRLRRPEDARRYLERIRRSRPNFWGARHAALMTAAEAIVAETGSDRLFDASIREIRSVGWSFDLPRVSLVYGEWLRRNHRVIESRSWSTHAADLFGQLGASTFERRAEDELRAAGAPTARRENDGDASTVLTGQEYRIASLAASGLTNKQIGEELYLSARTVGGHLYRVFPKLQVTKRSALRDALLRYEGAPTLSRS